jgi:ribose 5-phosphate isomerase RpiB
VSLEAVEQALVWANYLEAHARRIYVMAATGVGLAAARAILSKVRKGQLADGFTARDITQKNWAGLGREVVGAGLELLIEMDWLRKTEVRGRGRPKEIYLVNPLAVLTSNNS